MDAKISKSLLPMEVNIGVLKPMKGNPRKGDVNAMKRSLQRFGQRKPVVATEDGTITAGHHLHAAAIALGWQTIAVNFEDDDPVEAVAWALADNRTADLGRQDHALLLLQLQDVRAADAELLAAASYSDEDIAALSDLDNPAQPPDLGQDREPSNAVAGRSCPHCGEAL